MLDNDCILNEVLVSVWMKWGMALTSDQATEVFEPDTLKVAATLGMNNRLSEKLILDDLSEWVVGCKSPEIEEVEEDPECLEYFVTALLYMAEDAGVFVHN